MSRAHINAYRKQRAKLQKKIKDPTVARLFDTYRFADHKERVVDLLARVATASVRTVAIVEAVAGVVRRTPPA